MTPVRTILSLLALLLNFLSAWATHIVGGEITYRYMDSGRYKITLRYFVDCINGNPQAISQDTTANFGFFNAKSYAFIDVVSIPRNQPNRIKELHYKCIKFNADACVDEYIYEFEKIIDPGDSGIIIAYQRCCRNGTISNLVDPGGTGNTFFVLIPPRTETPVNSSPFFNKLPPNFLCTNAPLIFDHSASDPDGDSLVYSLIIPYTGASTFDPRPNRPSDPPFSRVTMKSGYTLSNMMGNAIPIAIDSASGELRVNPDKTGQFVVGILVREYRNGKLIGEIHRDYQFNVSECVFDVYANFISPDRVCNDTVHFKNLSSPDAIYHWDFGQANRFDDTASDRDISWYYGQLGKYKVTLEVEKDGCRDTFYNYVWFVQPDSIHARIKINPAEGCDLINAAITNNSDTTGYWVWNMGDGSPLKINATLNSYSYQLPGIYPISLLIVDSLKCNISDLAVDTVRVFQTPMAEFDFDTIWCSGEVFLTNQSYGYDSLHWYVNDVLDTSHESVPPIRFSESGSYSIRLIANKEFCSDTFSRTISVVVGMAVKADLHVNPLDGCSPLSVHFSGNKSESAITFLDLGDGTVWENRIDSLHRYESPGIYQILYVVIDSLSCNFKDTGMFQINVRNMPKADFEAVVEICTGKLNLKNLSQNISQTNWDFGNGKTSEEKQPGFFYNEDGEFKITLISDKDSLCSDTVSKTLKVEINNLGKLNLFNVFTPGNDDELNQYFRTDGLKGDCFEIEMWIYNRWGEMVFKNTSLAPVQAGWDGKKDGGGYFPAGAYFVIYKFTNKVTKEETSISGTVTLIR
jgi:PKD repeat protein